MDLPDADRYRVLGGDNPPVIGWSPTPETAAQRAAGYFHAGWRTVTITDTEPDKPTPIREDTA